MTSIGEAKDSLSSFFLVSGELVTILSNFIFENPNSISLPAEENGKLKDYSAGHISNEESGELIRLIDLQLGKPNIKFYPGVSYRHLLVLKGKKFSSDMGARAFLGMILHYSVTQEVYGMKKFFKTPEKKVIDTFVDIFFEGVPLPLQLKLGAR